MSETVEQMQARQALEDAVAEAIYKGLTAEEIRDSVEYALRQAA